jgi:hypothetical protein
LVDAAGRAGIRADLLLYSREILRLRAEGGAEHRSHASTLQRA